MNFQTQITLAIFSFFVANTTYAMDTHQFAKAAGGFLSDFSSAQQNCIDNDLTNPFKGSCPKFVLNNIENDLKSSLPLTKFVKIDSPYESCETEYSRTNASSPQQVTNLFTRHPAVAAVNGLDSTHLSACHASIDNLNVSEDVKGRIKNNTIAEFYINNKRLAEGSKNYLSEIATIDSILGGNIIKGHRCSDLVESTELKDHCQQLKKCSSQGGLDKLADETLQSMQDLEQIKNKRANQSIIEIRRSGPKNKKVSDLIQAVNPLVKGDVFKRSMKNKKNTKANIKSALKSQLTANKEKLKESLSKNEAARKCLIVDDSKSCKNLNEQILSNPEVTPFTINTNAQGIRAKNKEKDKIAFNHYASKVQCFSEVRNLKKQRTSDLINFGINSSLVIFTAGIGAAAAGARASSLAARAAARGINQPKWKALTELAKTPMGASKIAIFTADGAYASYAFIQAGKACDQKISELQKINDEQKNTQNFSCPKPLDSPSYNLQSDYKSCITEYALASLGILPFAPVIVSRLIKGRSNRTLLANKKYTKQQIEWIAELQNKFSDEEIKLILEQLKSLESTAVDSALQKLLRKDSDGADTTKSLKSNKNLKASQEGDYVPIKRDETVSMDEIKYANIEEIKTLDSMGISYQSLNKKAYVDVLDILNITRITDIRLDNSVGDQVLQIIKAPATSQHSNWSGLALTHKDLPKMIDDFAKMEYDFAVDTSLRTTGSGAYLSDSQKLVGIRADSTWDEVAHEYQHAQYDYFLKNNLGTLEHSIKNSTLNGKNKSQIIKELPSYIKNNWSKKEQDIIVRYIQDEIPDLALNEALSVNRQLENFGWKRFTPGNQFYNKYASDHMVTELTDLSDPTERHKQLIQQHKNKSNRINSYLKISNKATEATRAVNVVDTAQVTATSAGAIAIAYDTQQKEPLLPIQALLSKAKDILYSDKGLLIKDKNGDTHFIPNEKK